MKTTIMFDLRDDLTAQVRAGDQSAREVRKLAEVFNRHSLSPLEPVHPNVTPRTQFAAKYFFTQGDIPEQKQQAVLAEILACDGVSNAHIPPVRRLV